MYALLLTDKTTGLIYGNTIDSRTDSMRCWSLVSYQYLLDVWKASVDIKVKPRI